MKEEREWQAPTTLREYLKELMESFGTIRYVFTLADSKELRPWLYAKYASSFVSIIAGMLMTRFIAKVLQGVIDHDVDYIVAAIISMGCIYATKQILGFSFWYSHEWSFGLSLRQMYRNILGQFFAKSPGQHKHIRSLNYESIQKGRNKSADVFLHHARELFEIVVGILAAYAFILYYAPLLGLILGVTLGAHTALTMYVNFRLLGETAELEKDFSRFERYYVELLRLYPRIYVSGKRNEEIEKMSARWDELATRDRNAYIRHGKRVTLQDSMIVACVLYIFYQGSMWVTSGQWGSIAILYPLFAWSTLLTNELARMRGVEREVYKCIPSINVMRETLSIPSDVTDKPGAIPLVSDGPLTLEFENVSYAYPGSEETISDVSLTVAPGQKVALVGPTGAGKSTLEYLPLRFMNPSNGRVLVNGRDIRDYTIESVLAKIGYIPQKPLIFDGTVRFNLLYSLPEGERKNWNDEQLLELMRDLAIDFGVRPAGENPLDIVVGRDGVELSGGQAQRLAIGSVVIRRPELMIVDEATSALDTATETELLEGLRKWINGAGMLVIAHRLSTVRDSDKVVVLAAGKVEAIGESFDDLAKTSPTFQRLIAGQSHLLS